MVQLDSVLKCYSTPSIPYRLDSVTRYDEFAKELLELWRNREMKGIVYTAYLYTEPAGFILLQENDLYKCTIRGTWIHSALRGKGVGAFLMREVLRCNSDVDIIVNVTKGAEGFYEKFGFSKIGHRDDFDMDIYCKNHK